MLYSNQGRPFRSVFNCFNECGQNSYRQCLLQRGPDHDRIRTGRPGSSCPGCQNNFQKHVSDVTSAATENVFGDSLHVAANGAIKITPYSGLVDRLMLDIT